jgi:hypothetical protein
MIAFATIVLALGAGGAGAGCLPGEAQPGPGVVDPFKAPAPRATELNAAGKALYRQGKWEEARAQYRAALSADPSFLAPRLNVACSFVRQERFAEATAEARALLAEAYVPWAREILEAADMGALKVRPEMVELRRAMADAAARWGEGLDDSVVFVARQRAPLRVPETGAGVFILNPHQEAYAFSPATGRTRQLTAEDGRVLLVVRSPDRRRLAYVTAEKLVRGAAPGDVTLRGVALGELTLATMAAAPPIRVDGDVRRIELDALGAELAFRIEGDRVTGRFRRGEGGTLAPIPGRAAPAPRASAVLTAAGAAPAPALAVGGACAASAREAVGPDGKRTVVVTARARTTHKLGEVYGAGLGGLPLP